MSIFSLDKFVNEASLRGFSRPNRFEIEMPLPAGMNATGRFAQETMHLYCEITSLPPQIVNVKQQRIYGPAYQRPISTEFGGEGITMTFYLDKNMMIKGYFDAWMALIVDPHQYYVNYPDNYTVPIRIRQLDEQDQISYVAILEDAFPRNVAMVELNNSIQNQVNRLNVTFAYRRWTPVQYIYDRNIVQIFQENYVSKDDPFTTKTRNNTNDTNQAIIPSPLTSGDRTTTDLNTSPRIDSTVVELEADRLNNRYTINKREVSREEYDRERSRIYSSNPLP
jgi:hypothetical protein